MRRALALAGLAGAFAFRAAAQPKFSTVPGGGKRAGGGDEGGFSVDLASLAESPWAQASMEFLGNYYGYLGVVFVMLALFIFARGPGGQGKAAAATDGSDEDFFDPAESESFRDLR